LIGPHAAIERLVAAGPRLFRALRSRKGQPRSAAQMAAAAKLSARANEDAK
jgi:hypothetical protein